MIILQEHLMDFRLINDKLLLPKMLPIFCWPWFPAKVQLNYLKYMHIMQLHPVPLVEAHSVQDTIYIVLYCKVNDSPCSLSHLALFQRSFLLMKTWKLLWRWQGNLKATLRVSRASGKIILVTRQMTHHCGASTWAVNKLHRQLHEMSKQKWKQYVPIL